MKFAVTSLLSIASLVTANLYAEDHAISANALSAVGLGGMKAVSDQRGETVRGSGFWGTTTSLTTVSVVLHNPITGSKTVYTDSEFAHAVVHDDPKKSYGHGGYGSPSNGHAPQEAKVVTHVTTKQPIKMNESFLFFHYSGRASFDLWGGAAVSNRIH